MDHEIRDPTAQSRIDNVAIATFPEEWEVPAKAKFEKLTDADLDYMFDETADIFRVGEKLPY